LLLFLQRGDELVRLRDGGFHIMNQIVDVGLHADLFVAQPGDGFGVKVIFDKKPLIAQGHQSGFQFGLGLFQRFHQLCILGLGLVIFALAGFLQAFTVVLFDLLAPFMELPARNTGTMTAEITVFPLISISLIKPTFHSLESNSSPVKIDKNNFNLQSFFIFPERLNGGRTL